MNPTCFYCEGRPCFAHRRLSCREWPETEYGPCGCTEADRADATTEDQTMTTTDNKLDAIHLSDVRVVETHDLGAWAVVLVGSTYGSICLRVGVPEHNLGSVLRVDTVRSEDRSAVGVRRTHGKVEGCGDSLEVWLPPALFDMADDVIEHVHDVVIAAWWAAFEAQGEDVADVA